MDTTPLPPAVLALPRSNMAFLGRLGLFLGGFALTALALPMVAQDEYVWTWGLLVAGTFMMAGGAISLGLWAGRSAREVRDVFDQLTQAELMSLLGRDSETWLSSHSVMVALDRRFPGWREDGSTS